ncbi:RING zinc finger-containing protein, partial [Reticulomyxa filosa]
GYNKNRTKVLSEEKDSCYLQQSYKEDKVMSAGEAKEILLPTKEETITITTQAIDQHSQYIATTISTSTNEEKKDNNLASSSAHDKTREALLDLAQLDYIKLPFFFFFFGKNKKIKRKCVHTYMYMYMHLIGRCVADSKVVDSKSPNVIHRRSSLPTDTIGGQQRLVLPGISEVVPMIRAISLDTGIVTLTTTTTTQTLILRAFFFFPYNQEENKKPDVLSVRQVSFEVLTEELTQKKKNIYIYIYINIKKKGKGDKETKEEHKEEIAVPPRDVLLRMPLYSTPLTLEATNNAYRDFVHRLVAMGFELGQAECAITMTKAESVEVAVEFIFQHPDGLWHRFRPNDKLLVDAHKHSAGDACLFFYKFVAEDVCETCKLLFWRHYVDPNGDKIDVTPPEGPHLDISDEKTSTDTTATTTAGATTTTTTTATTTSGATTHLTVAEILAQEENRPKPVGPTQLCGVCFDEKPPDQFYLAPCGHNYCMECLERHYK